MNQALPPEKQPHPAREVAASDSTGDPDVEKLRWKRVPVSCEDNNWGQVSLGVVTKDTANTSAYALAIVYASQPRTASLMIASPQHRRVWVNDVCVYDNPTANDTMELLECVPISLQPGRNNIVVRISTKAAQCHFLLRLGDGPLERALVAARLMQWEQAAAAFEQIPPQELVRAGHLWAIYCQCLAAARDVQRHARAIAIEYARCRSVSEEFLLSEMLRAGTMLPNDQLTSEVLHAILTDLGEPVRDWQRIAKGRAAVPRRRVRRSDQLLQSPNEFGRQRGGSTGDCYGISPTGAAGGSGSCLAHGPAEVQRVDHLARRQAGVRSDVAHAFRPPMGAAAGSPGADTRRVADAKIRCASS